MTQYDSIVDITEDAYRSFFFAVEGDLSKIIGESKARFMKVGGHKGAPVGSAAVAVYISPQGLPKTWSQFISFFRSETKTLGRCRNF